MRSSPTDFREVYRERPASVEGGRTTASDPLGALEPLEKAPALRDADHGVHRREGKADPTGRVSIRIAAAARPALQPAAARSNSSARWVAASRTAARSPAKICRSVTIAPPRRPLPNQTRPTGLAGVPPPGP